MIANIVGEIQWSGLWQESQEDPSSSTERWRWRISGATAAPHLSDREVEHWRRIEACNSESCIEVSAIRGIPYMTSTKYFDILTPSPLSVCKIYVSLFVSKFRVHYLTWVDVLYGSPPHVKIISFKEFLVSGHVVNCDGRSRRRRYLKYITRASARG